MKWNIKHIQNSSSKLYFELLTKSKINSKKYLWCTIVVEPCEGDGDNECDFSINTGDAEVENSESGEIGFDGSLRNDRSLNSFSPDNLLPVMFSKSTLKRRFFYFAFIRNYPQLLINLYINWYFLDKKTRQIYLVNSQRALPSDGNEFNCTFSSSYCAAAHFSQFVMSWKVHSKGSKNYNIVEFYHKNREYNCY